LIPDEIHDRFECVVFHMTDLPYGRGGTPLQNLIVRGHKETKLSALRCAAELDAGPIYLKRPLSLAGTAEDIFSRATDAMQEMIVEIVRRRPEPEPQKGEPTVFPRRRPEDGNFAKLERLKEIYDYIRMLDAEGYPPAFLETEHFRFEFSGASIEHGAVQAKVSIRKRQP
jgi:methionyl-tRNA formyltransferase